MPHVKLGYNDNFTRPPDGLLCNLARLVALTAIVSILSVAVAKLREYVCRRRPPQEAHRSEKNPHQSKPPIKGGEPEIDISPNSFADDMPNSGVNDMPNSCVNEAPNSLVDDEPTDISRISDDAPQRPRLLVKALSRHQRRRRKKRQQQRAAAREKNTRNGETQDEQSKLDEDVVSQRALDEGAALRRAEGGRKGLPRPASEAGSGGFKSEAVSHRPAFEGVPGEDVLDKGEGEHVLDEGESEDVLNKGESEEVSRFTFKAVPSEGVAQRHAPEEVPVKGKGAQSCTFGAAAAAGEEVSHRAPVATSAAAAAAARGNGFPRAKARAKRRAAKGTLKAAEKVCGSITRHVRGATPRKSGKAPRLVPASREGEDLTRSEAADRRHAPEEAKPSLGKGRAHRAAKAACQADDAAPRLAPRAAACEKVPRPAPPRAAACEKVPRPARGAEAFEDFVLCAPVAAAGDDVPRCAPGAAACQEVPRCALGAPDVEEVPLCAAGDAVGDDFLDWAPEEAASCEEVPSRGHEVVRGRAEVRGTPKTAAEASSGSVSPHARDEDSGKGEGAPLQERESGTGEGEGVSHSALRGVAADEDSGNVEGAPLRELESGAGEGEGVSHSAPGVAAAGEDEGVRQHPDEILRQLPQWCDPSHSDGATPATEEFFINDYKTIRCIAHTSPHDRQSPRHAACPMYHTPFERRRSPLLYFYTPMACEFVQTHAALRAGIPRPKTKKGFVWGDPSQCPKGDRCDKAHTKSEQSFHPKMFRTSMCAEAMRYQNAAAAAVGTCDGQRQRLMPPCVFGEVCAYSHTFPPRVKIKGDIDCRVDGAPDYDKIAADFAEVAAAQRRVLHAEKRAERRPPRRRRRGGRHITSVACPSRPVVEGAPDYDKIAADFAEAAAAQRRALHAEKRAERWEHFHGGQEKRPPRRRRRSGQRQPYGDRDRGRCKGGSGRFDEVEIDERFGGREDGGIGRFDGHRCYAHVDQNAAPNAVREDAADGYLRKSYWTPRAFHERGRGSVSAMHSTPPGKFPGMYMYRPRDYAGGTHRCVSPHACLSVHAPPDVPQNSVMSPLLPLSQRGGRFEQSEATPSERRPLQAAGNQYERPHVTSSNWRPLQAAGDHFERPKIISSDRRPLQAAGSKYDRPHITSRDPRPLQAAGDHFERPEDYLPRELLSCDGHTAATTAAGLPAAGWSQYSLF